MRGECVSSSIASAPCAGSSFTVDGVELGIRDVSLDTNPVDLSIISHCCKKKEKHKYKLQIYLTHTYTGVVSP